MSSRSKQFVFLLTLALLMLLAPARVHAQAPENEAAQQTPATSQVVHEREEESGQETDPARQLRNSPAVKWIAKITGLSENGAYWLCVSLNFGAVAFIIVYLLR